MGRMAGVQSQLKSNIGSSLSTPAQRSRSHWGIRPVSPRYVQSARQMTDKATPTFPYMATALTVAVAPQRSSGGPIYCLIGIQHVLRLISRRRAYH